MRTQCLVSGVTSERVVCRLCPCSGPGRPAAAAEPLTPPLTRRRPFTDASLPDAHVAGHSRNQFSMLLTGGCFMWCIVSF